MAIARAPLAQVTALALLRLREQYGEKATAALYPTAWSRLFQEVDTELSTYSEPEE